MNLLSLHRDFKDLGRLETIMTTLVKEGFHSYLSDAKLAKHAKVTSRITHGRKHAEPTPVRVRKALEKLGPTFVKLGQILSLRPDLVPKEYCEEFKKTPRQY